MLTDQPVRFHHLRAYGRSPAHGRHARTNEMKSTQAMQRGRMVHGMLADEGRFVAYPGAQRRGKEYKKFADAHPGYEILLKNDYDLAKAMSDAVRARPDAMRWLAGIRERTLFFDYNGLTCRSTPDVHNPDERYLTEIKSTANAAEWFWQFHFRRMGYHVQMWMQGMGCDHLIEKFNIVAVEDKPPHVVMLYELQPRALDEGAKLLMLWSERLKVSESSGLYPGYSTAVVPLDIPDEPVELIYGDEDDGAPERDVTMAG